MNTRISELRTAIRNAERMLSSLGDDKRGRDVYHAIVRMCTDMGFSAVEKTQFATRYINILPTDETRYSDICRFIKIFTID